MQRARRIGKEGWPSRGGKGKAGCLLFAVKGRGGKEGTLACDEGEEERNGTKFEGKEGSITTTRGIGKGKRSRRCKKEGGDRTKKNKKALN